MGKVIRGSKESGKGARKRREGATVRQRVTLHNENERTAKRKKRGEEGRGSGDESEGE